MWPPCHPLCSSFSAPQKQLSLKGPLGGCRQLPVPEGLPGCLLCRPSCPCREGGGLAESAGSLGAAPCDSSGEISSQEREYPCQDVFFLSSESGLSGKMPSSCVPEQIASGRLLSASPSQLQGGPSGLDEGEGTQVKQGERQVTTGVYWERFSGRAETEGPAGVRAGLCVAWGPQSLWRKWAPKPGSGETRPGASFGG